MSDYQKIVSQIRDLTKVDSKNKVQRALKLSEEVGKVAAAVMSETNAPGCEYKTLNRLDVLQECVDTIIVAFSLLDQYEFSDREIISKFEEKLYKWKRVCSVDRKAFISVYYENDEDDEKELGWYWHIEGESPTGPFHQREGAMEDLNRILEKRREFELR